MVTTQEQINQMVRIADLIAEGDLNELPNQACPYCNTHALMFSFTVKKSRPAYGLYIVCQNCKEITHFSLVRKPQNFREDLVIENFQRVQEAVELVTNELMDRIDLKPEERE